VRGHAVVALVPTMGALHAGHLSLIERARESADVVVVSIFVNPTQFSDPTDFELYPRDLEHDLAVVAGVGADLVFAPSEREMYPAGAPQVTVDPGPLGLLLEGRSRPGHFRGVATVVAKLFDAVAPNLAYFGEKDYQQLLLVTRLVEDLSLPVRVIGCPTVREDDGLALSSRNGRLSPAERRAAPVLYQSLLAGRGALALGASPEEAEAAMAGCAGAEELVALDYARVLDAASLGPPADGPLRLLIAALVGPVRLIDNLSADEAPPKSIPQHR
jgi:pantoate--beta-alanine ligase